MTIPSITSTNQCLQQGATLTLLVPKPFISLRKMSWSGGDWICSACQHSNFKKRDTCHRCGYPKYGGPDPTTYMSNRTEVLAGDWYCNCGAHNYASRSNCFRCSAYKNDYAAVMGSGGYGSDCSAPPGWKSGDWICSRMGCGVHNYASRTECFKCRTPKEYGG
ncbi:hypothetical protein CMV_014747 [Castanea mollissima]|uniref:RanBP2-type domain-containing protein n=1 Tax=Castanea mollissima TaxID=60419 RepID=A0A8J4RAU6_9ROSI|nr:hypothetical protein CMV_014747 [Castanea mollissima]